MPVDWSGFTLHYRFGSTHYHFDVRQGSSPQTSMTVNDQRLSGNAITLEDDGLERWIRVDCRAPLPGPQAMEFAHAVDE
jgi:cellobiose phosphorylase